MGACPVDHLAGHPELAGDFFPTLRGSETMTVRVERTLVLPAERDAVWAFIDDPEKRARAISVVEGYEAGPDRTATWHVALPIPVIDHTVAVETEERRRDPPSYVEFVGRSRIMRVVGEHELEEHEGGTRLTTRFVVDGRLPGVERFFERRLDAELENLEAALFADLGLESGDQP